MKRFYLKAHFIKKNKEFYRYNGKKDTCEQKKNHHHTLYHIIYSYKYGRYLPG